MPIYNLPPAIVCNVSHVHLKAEAITDEAFAQITLLPLSKQEDISVETENCRPAPQNFNVSSFRKKLTQSDTRTHGGFTVPKRSALECLPHLDMSQDPPVQELVAKDLHGCKWRFRHVYRGKPKRHLLTSGWSTFVSSKKLVAGDICIFLRGENGEVQVGVHRADVQKNAPTSVISVRSMQHGVLTSAFHAICSRTIFSVVYRPWTTPNEFIVPLEKYMNATETDYSIGTRVRMQVEGEEGVEHNSLNRVLADGIVVGHEDVDHIRWPNSEWKCLKVKWEATPGVFTCPDRVSPWNIEPMGSWKKKTTPGLNRYKRLCARDIPMPGISDLAQAGLFRSSVWTAFQSNTTVLQGQESGDTDMNESGASTTPLMPLFDIQMNPNKMLQQPRQENPPRSPIDKFNPCFSSSVLYPSENDSVLPSYRPSAVTSYFLLENADASRIFADHPNINSLSVSHDRTRALGCGDEMEPPLNKPNSLGRCMLFGVNLCDDPQELPSPQFVTPNEFYTPSVTPISQCSVSETTQVQEACKSTSSIFSESQCNKSCSFTGQNFTEVVKYGTDLQISVDLMQFDGYEDLIYELDRKFNFKGSLIDSSSNWDVTYADNVGNMIPIGDNPWQEFQQMMSMLIIYPKKDGILAC